MRLWTARGIPTVMAGTPGIELAHAVDERVRVDDLVTLARALARPWKHSRRLTSHSAMRGRGSCARAGR